MYIETLKESPDIKTKILAIIANAEEPIPKDVLIDALSEWEVDMNEPGLDNQIEEILNSSEIHKTSDGEIILYSIDSEKSDAVQKTVETLCIEAHKAIAKAGMKYLGLE